MASQELPPSPVDSFIEPPTPPHRPIDAVWFLAAGLAGTFVFSSIDSLSLRGPPTPGLFTLLAILVLPLGAHIAAGAWRQPAAFTIYGAIGGAFFTPYSVPSVWTGAQSQWAFAFDAAARISAPVVAGALLCRWIANQGIKKDDLHRWAERCRCRVCGYLLIGLPERRCPECGTLF